MAYYLSKYAFAIERLYTMFKAVSVLFQVRYSLLLNELYKYFTFYYNKLQIATKKLID